MIRRPAAGVGMLFGLLGAWLGSAVGALILAWSNRSVTSDLRSLDSSDLAYVATSMIFTLVFAIVGTVVVIRARHSIGWLLVSVAITWMIPLLLEQYVIHGLIVAPGSLPVTTLATWAATWTFAIVILPLTLILLLFPSGTLQASRWRARLLVLAAAATLLETISAAVGPGELGGSWTAYGVVVMNPLGLDVPMKLLNATSTTGTVLSACIALASMASLLIRFRASRDVERQQIKWLAFVALAAAVLILANIVASLIATDTPAENAVGSIGWGVLVTTLMLGMPLSIGAAVLRYRLYDIDRIISRTLAYALVTALLGGTFASLVLLPPVVLGGESAPDYVIAVATLVVAALFGPVRRRVQDAVDHRFNRKRYDAEHTIDAFTARLREQVDIDALGAELNDVVRRTMEPAHVSVWLR
jgi:hypothetical protein